ncbi:MAG: DUF1223 domain-containing protein [Hyphomicrobiales bacterium]
MKAPIVHLSRRAALSLALTAGLFAAVGGSMTVSADEGRQVAVVELFTSQGCSSCPPADKFAGKLQGRKDVIALSFNVDYWDYLGWKDTLGSPEATKRQKDYARFRGDGRVYTPQMVVNGGHHFVGSDEKRVNFEIDRQLSRKSSEFVPVSFAQDKKELTINLGGTNASEIKQDSTVWLMLVSRKVDQKIQRGENHGQTISYHNVVRKAMPVGMWKGDAKSIKLPMSDLMTSDIDDCVVLIQSSKSGEILGASILENPGGV